MHSKLILCILLLCSFVFIATSSHPPPPSYQLARRGLSDDIPTPLLEDDNPIEEDEEDEEATSSLNHIDEDDAKEIVEEIDIWANIDTEDGGTEEAEEDLVDDDEEDTADEEDDGHDHEDDEEEEEEDEDEDFEEDEDEEQQEEEGFDDELEEQELASDPDTTQSEMEEELKWTEQHNPDQSDQSSKSIPQEINQPPPPTYDDIKLAEQEHANAELEAKEQESSLMDIGNDEADIPPPDHYWSADIINKETPPKDWDHIVSDGLQEPCHSRTTLIWLGLLACCLVLAYRAHTKSKNTGLDGDSKHSILPVSFSFWRI